MAQAQYSDEELAALLVLLFKVTSSDIDTYPDAGTQIKTYKNSLTPAVANNQEFGKALKAFVAFYDNDPDGTAKYPNRYMVTTMRQSLAAVLAGMAATGLWGECRHVGHDQVERLSGLALAKPQAADIVAGHVVS